MAFQAVPDTAAFVLEVGSADHVWSNVFHGRKPDFDVYQMIAVAEDIFTAVKASDYKENLFTGFSLRHIRAYDLRTDGGPVYTTVGAVQAGLEASPVLPVQDACVITLRTLVRGRSGRGRLFFSGFTEGGLSGGEWQILIPPAMVQMCALIDAAMVAQGWTYVLVSRWHEGVKRNPAITIPIEAYENRSSIPGGQERRSLRP